MSFIAVVQPAGVSSEFIHSAFSYDSARVHDIDTLGLVRRRESL